MKFYLLILTVVKQCPLSSELNIHYQVIFLLTAFQVIFLITCDAHQAVSVKKAVKDATQYGFPNILDMPEIGFVGGRFDNSVRLCFMEISRILRYITKLCDSHLSTYYCSQNAAKIHNFNDQSALKGMPFMPKLQLSNRALHLVVYLDEILVYSIGISTIDIQQLLSLDSYMRLREL